MIKYKLLDKIFTVFFPIIWYAVKNIMIYESIFVVKPTQKKITYCQGVKGKVFKKKLVFSKNKIFKMIEKLLNILDEIDNLMEHLKDL